MPGRSGLAVLEDVRRARGLSALPVLIVTGYVLDEVEETRIHDLRAYVFHKPAAFPELLRYLDSATGV